MRAAQSELHARTQSAAGRPTLFYIVCPTAIRTMRNMLFPNCFKLQAPRLITTGPLDNRRRRPFDDIFSLDPSPQPPLRRRGISDSTGRRRRQVTRANIKARIELYHFPLLYGIRFGDSEKI